MSGSKRKTVDLGAFGRVPIDNMFELYLETKEGDLLTFYQTRCIPSIGGWVYDAAACLARYLETDHFNAFLQSSNKLNSSETGKEIWNTRYPLKGRTFLELGAGTGIVGIMAAYYGADVVITDLESLVPLIQFNINANLKLLKGKVTATPLCWGSEVMLEEALRSFDAKVPDFVILANCVYYETSLEPLLESVLDSTGADSTVLACYEEKTKEIKGLISRWHALGEQHLVVEDLPKGVFDTKYGQDYVRMVTMKRRISSD